MCAKIAINVIVEGGMFVSLEVLMRLITLPMPNLDCCSSHVRQRWTIIITQLDKEYCGVEREGSRTDELRYYFE
jgi:hypothetical protein